MSLYILINEAQGLKKQDPNALLNPKIIVSVQGTDQFFESPSVGPTLAPKFFQHFQLSVKDPYGKVVSIVLQDGDEDFAKCDITLTEQLLSTILPKFYPMTLVNPENDCSPEIKVSFKYEDDSSEEIQKQETESEEIVDQEQPAEKEIESEKANDMEEEEKKESSDNSEAAPEENEKEESEEPVVSEKEQNESDSEKENSEDNSEKVENENSEPAEQETSQDDAQTPEGDVTDQKSEQKSESDDDDIQAEHSTEKEESNETSDAPEKQEEEESDENHLESAKEEIETPQKKEEKSSTLPSPKRSSPGRTSMSPSNTISMNRTLSRSDEKTKKNLERSKRIAQNMSEQDPDAINYEQIEKDADERARATYQDFLNQVAAVLFENEKIVKSYEEEEEEETSSSEQHEEEEKKEDDE